MDMARADIFLADCLLESIEDENYQNTKRMLVGYNADCNLIIPGREIAAIHYAAGMENTAYAESVMKLMLKNGGNPNARTTDGETPVHIAAIWNRELIIEMLLDHGGDLTLKDNEGNTAINNAITEKHYNLIPIFKNYIFEEKLQKRIQNRSKEAAMHSPSVRKLTNVMQRLEIPPSIDTNGESSPRCDKMLTPNKTNFNFDEASPYLINITHRRKPNRPEAIQEMSKLRRTISVDKNILANNISNETFGMEKRNATSPNALNTSDNIYTSDEDVVIVEENLFQLTELNLEKHLKSTPKHNRISLVNMWRNKVNKSHRRASVAPANELELDSFILKHTGELGPLTSSKMSTPVSNSSSAETVLQAPSKKNCVKNDEKQDEMKCEARSVSADSFVTAVDENGEVILVERNEFVVDASNGSFNFHSTKKDSTNVRSPNGEQILLQIEEAYMHTDTENDIVFYEQRCIANPAPPKSYKSSNPNESIVASESCPETEYTIPLDYDTDVLRRELTQYGDVPGPITKSTKRLYLKRLNSYKRKPLQTAATSRELTKASPNFSVELKKTLRTDNATTWQVLINKYNYLERQMIDGFHLCPTKRFREGNLKTSFIYLLIDPRISENLPHEAQIISKHEAWQRFLASIFYVGKGKSNRPYAHLYEAIKIYQDKGNAIEMPTKNPESLKLERISDIWRTGKGVVCLAVFHNIMPVEAYTREATIIDCIGVGNLTNIKRGDYYGISKSWTMRQRKQLGIWLLYKAMHVLMIEGESQLRPDDIKHRK